MTTRNPGRWRQRLHQEQGLGLVEVLVAMVIAGIALSALAQTLIGSFAAVGDSERRLGATQVATEAVEEIQSLEWSDIGFYNADGYPAPVVDGSGNWEVVELGSSAPVSAPPNRPLPTRVVTVDGTPYTIATTIVWDAVPPVTADEMVRKRIQVVASWTARTTTKSVTASSYVALPGTSVQPAAFYMLLASAGAAYQLIDDNGAPLNAMGVAAPVLLAAETNREASGVSAAWTDRTGSAAGAMLLNPLGDEQTWARDFYGGTFVNGPTTFTFTANAAGYPPDTRQETVTFLHDDVEPVTPLTIVSGLRNGAICTRLNLLTTDTLVFEVGVQGFLAADSATLSHGLNVPWNGTTTATTVSGVTQRITVPSGAVIAPVLGQAAFTLSVARTSALPTGADVSVHNFPVNVQLNASRC